MNFVSQGAIQLINIISRIILSKTGRLKRRLMIEIMRAMNIWGLLTKFVYSEVRNGGGEEEMGLREGKKGVRTNIPKPMVEFRASYMYHLYVGNGP